MRRNITLDAALVHAAMHGLFEPCAIRMGMSPNQAFARADWLKKQPETYIDQVARKVERIEQAGKARAGRGRRRG